MNLEKNPESYSLIDSFENLRANGSVVIKEDGTIYPSFELYRDDKKIAHVTVIKESEDSGTNIYINYEVGAEPANEYIGKLLSEIDNIAIPD